MTSRLDQLAAADRLLLREASVLGTVIDTEILAISLGRRLGAVARAMARPRGVRDDEQRSAAVPSLVCIVTSPTRACRTDVVAKRTAALVRRSRRRAGERLRRVGGAVVHALRRGRRARSGLAVLAHRRRAVAWRRTPTSRRPSSTDAPSTMDESIRVPKPELVAVAEALGDVSELAGRYDEGSARLSPGGELQGRGCRSCAAAAQRGRAS